VAQVAITVNGRNYQVACDEGQEDHLVRLADYVDKRIAELVSAMGQIGDARLLVMASLLVADELSDTYAELSRAREGTGEAERAAEVADTLADNVEALAARIEDIAARLEHP